MNVTISKEHDDTLYAGTPFFIKCDIMLDPLVTIPVTVTNQWTRDGTNVPMGSFVATITEGFNMINTLYYNATLMFYPLDNADDSGMYTCNVKVTAPYFRNTSAKANTSIAVIGKHSYIVLFYPFLIFIPSPHHYSYKASSRDSVYGYG